MSANVLIKEQQELEMASRKMLLTADDYQLMGAAGVFKNKPRVELINGEIYTMSPLTPNHNAHVDKASEFFIYNLFGKAKIRTQGSIRLDEYSEPEPDISILKFKDNFYSDQQATAKDTHLIIEVAVFTVNGDRTTKLKKYASAGIPEYWIIIPQQKIIEVYQQPTDGTYAKKTTYKRKDKWVIEPFKLKAKGSDFLI